MILAIKGNKQLEIDEKEKQAYLDLGFDIAESNGTELKIIDYPKSKAIAYEKYVALEEENKKLKAEISKLKKANKEEKGDK